MDNPIADRLTKPLSDVAAASLQNAFDAVVIGGGSAGITTARTLVEAGKRVVLLEAGPLALLTHVQSTDLRFDPNLVRAVQQALQYSPQSASGGPFGSLIGCVGGRGLFWNGAAPRFAADDFEQWPFSYDDLELYYRWAEDQFRVNTEYGGGRLCDIVCQHLKAASIPAQVGPYAVDNHLTANGWLAGTVGNSLSPLLRSTVLTTATNEVLLATKAFARKVIVQNGVAQGVEVVDLGDGSVHSVRARSVVLAAGAFESVRLALVSTVADPFGLIGRFISDHTFIRAYYPAPPNLYDPVNPEIAIAWVPAQRNQNYQIEIHLPADNLFQRHSATVWRPDSSQYYAAMVRSFAPLQPRAANFIEALAGDRPGSFRVRMSLDADDQAVVQAQITALEDVREALGAQAAQVQVLPQGASHHESGGLVMGADPQTSVCDGFGQVRTVKGLYAFDSSAWPNTLAANPHLTIVAIARRQATNLAAEL